MFADFTRTRALGVSNRALFGGEKDSDVWGVTYNVTRPVVREGGRFGVPALQQRGGR